LIRVSKLFLIILLVSIFIVWLSNNPGEVEILWERYLIQTNLFGLFLVFFVTIFTLFLIHFFLSKIRNIPRDFRSNRKEKHLKLANKSLDNIAESLLLGDSDNLEKNSRKLKKYLNNDFFSTFLLFNSSLIRNDLTDSHKYLKILESIPKAAYIAKRGRIIVLLKNKEVEEAKKTLINLCDEDSNDLWFHEKLSKIYSLEKNWEMAHDYLQRVPKIPIQLRDYFADLKILSGKDTIDAYKFSNQSINVVKETIKYFIGKSSLRKAAEIVEKNWNNLLCLEVIEVFMQYKIQNDSDTLRRYKLVLRNLKKIVNESSNETKLALAFASFEASIWGEAQNYLDQIRQDEWDYRVVNLYKRISEKTKKIKYPAIMNDVLPEPKWKCRSCNHQYPKWEFVCTNCSSLGTVVWPKSKIKDTSDGEFFREFLQNPLRHLPKMQRKD